MREEKEIEEKYQEYFRCREDRLFGEQSRGYLAALEWVLQKGPYSYELDIIIQELELLYEKYPHDFALKLAMDSFKTHKEEIEKNSLQQG